MQRWSKLRAQREADPVIRSPFDARSNQNQIVQFSLPPPGLPRKYHDRTIRHDRRVESDGRYLIETNRLRAAGPEVNRREHALSEIWIGEEHERTIGLCFPPG